MLRVGILTSSRADYGIYLPLLKELRKDPYFKLNIIVFGTHLSSYHGESLKQILNDGFEATFKIESLLLGDSPNSISTSMALTSLKFAEFWNNHQYEFDIVFCLGDRYEMFAAVIASIPYNIPIAHIHGGETTLGAFDNFFRHSITLATKYHFVSCNDHKVRVSELTGTYEGVFDIGALSLDNLSSIKLLSKDKFLKDFRLDLNIPTILVTMHPETIFPERNKNYVDKLALALLELKDYQVLISMPNADTLSSVIRQRFKNLQIESGGRIFCFENLGIQAYFTAMSNCSFLIGNTSSGIIEAASFNKWVINVGNRQKGRKHSKNIINVPFNVGTILNAVRRIEKNSYYTGNNIYYKGEAAKNICSILKKLI